MGLSMARAHPKVTATALLLLLLCSASSGRPPTAPPTPPATPPAPPAEAPPFSPWGGLLGRGARVAGGLLERLKPPTAPQSIREAYERGTVAVMTYTGILTDQLYHWWQGEQ